MEFFFEDFDAGLLLAAPELTEKYVGAGGTELNPGGGLVNLASGNVTYGVGDYRRQYVQTVPTDCRVTDFTVVLLRIRKTMALGSSRLRFSFFGG